MESFKPLDGEGGIQIGCVTAILFFVSVQAHLCIKGWEYMKSK
jgi:hypothetical protein